MYCVYPNVENRNLPTEARKREFPSGHRGVHSPNFMHLTGKRIVCCSAKRRSLSRVFWVGTAWSREMGISITTGVSNPLGTMLSKNVGDRRRSGRP